MSIKGATKGVVFFIFLLAGCSTANKNSVREGAVGELLKTEDTSSVNGAAAKSSAQFYQVSARPLEVKGQKLEIYTFDLPVVVNPSVEKWMAYFQGKGRKYFEKYLERGRYFIPEISKVLKAYNMPQDLVYLAMIESGFNNSAKSRARAVGPWQFIRQTGMRYGLRVDYWIDERRDTRKATLAAIKYLRELYQEFGSWELAAAGYNAGENKVRRAISKYRTNDFWEIARHRFFKRETRDYVPKIMAAAILTKNASTFGFNEISDDIKILGSATAKIASGENGGELTPKELGEESSSDDTAEDLVESKPEPANGEVAPDTEGSDDVAVEDEEAAEEDHAVALNGSLVNFTPSIYMVSNPDERISEFAVKGPADLFAISRAAALPFSVVKLLNPELLRWCTPPDMKLYKIKLPDSVKGRFLKAYNESGFERSVVFMKYTVRHGDNISKVAQRFGIEGDPIRELNSLAKRSQSLRTGATIVLPVPTGYKRIISSIYDDKPISTKKRYRRRRPRRHRSYNRTTYHRGASAKPKARAEAGHLNTPRVVPKYTKASNEG